MPDRELIMGDLTSRNLNGPWTDPQTPVVIRSLSMTSLELFAGS